MKIIRLDRFKKAYKKLPSEIQKKVDKALTLLLSDPKYPSLRVRKMESDPSKWYLRIDLHYRMTFEIDEEDNSILRNVGGHDPALDRH